MSCQISANQREAETSANVNKHWKPRAKGNNVITNVNFANQHFASTFSLQIPEMQLKALLPFPVPPQERPGELTRRLGEWKNLTDVFKFDGFEEKYTKPLTMVSPQRVNFS